MHAFGYHYVMVMVFGCDFGRRDLVIRCKQQCDIWTNGKLSARENQRINNVDSKCAQKTQLPSAIRLIGTSHPRNLWHLCYSSTAWTDTVGMSLPKPRSARWSFGPVRDNERMEVVDDGKSESVFYILNPIINCLFPASHTRSGSPVPSSVECCSHWELDGQGL